MIKNITCIVCPRGCSMTAELDNGTVIVKGNSCPKGEEYAKNECTHPRRTVTTTVRVANRSDTMVSVKTENPIPKENVFDAVKQIRTAQINAPVQVGEVLFEDVFGSRVVVTKEIN